VGAIVVHLNQNKGEVRHHRPLPRVSA
jgi:hypothetical protein